MTQLAEIIFKDEITQQGLNELRERFEGVVVPDMKVDENFKAARKIRTERNKLAEAMKRRRIDVSTEIKELEESIMNEVDRYYGPTIEAFEEEDQYRKEEAARLKRIEEEKVAASRKQVAEINQFYSQCIGKDSAYIEGMIESVDLIEVDSFHKDVIHEAIEAKKVTMANLTQLLSDTRAREKVAAEEEALAAEREKLAAERAEFEAWKAQQASKEQPTKKEPVTDEAQNATQRAEKAQSTQYLGHPNSKKQEQSPVSYEPLAMWPSDMDCAENEWISELCEKLNEAEAYIAFLERQIGLKAA